MTPSPAHHLRRAGKLLVWTLTFQLPRRLRERRAAQQILDSRVFDPAFYARRHPDVAGHDPVVHYVRHGASEGRSPCALFDPAFYLRQLDDDERTRATANPLLHFLETGAARGIDPCALFDVDYYVARNPDAMAPGNNPIRHFVEVGARAERRPHPLFDTAWVASQLPEVVASGVNPLAYHLEHAVPRPAMAAEEPAPDKGPALSPYPIAPPPKLLAFYLPQYHPIPENDDWWGEGFTEWTNVTRARPRYPGHEQPRLPADLGFYDLRIAEVRERQAALARAYGIDGFVYYYYWFNGRRVLDRPLAEVLERGEPDFPLCLCWANENWTRRWDGLEDEVLLEQEHDLASDYRFIQDVLPILKDPRYITVDGRPLLIVYRADKLADPSETAALWRDAAEQAGLPGLHLCAVQFRIDDPRSLGFDAAIEFPPHHFAAPRLSPHALGADPGFAGEIVDYAAGVSAALARPAPDYVVYRGLSPSWDNTARRGANATIYHGATPAEYERWLDGLVDQAMRRGGEASRFVFVNAWNEWAEGTYLEPDQRHGRAFLEATKRVVRRRRVETLPAEGTVIDSAPGALPWTTPASHRKQRGGRPLLFVAHDAAEAGSQFVLLHLLEALVERHDVRPYLILLADGPLLPRYRRVAHTLVAASLLRDGMALDGLLEKATGELRGEGLEVAVCNTVVTASALDALRTAGLRTISLLHEQPSSIDALFGGCATMGRVTAGTDRLVAVSRFARDALCERYGLERSQIDVLYPPLRPLPPAELPRAKLRASLVGRDDADICLVLGCGSLYSRKGPDLFVELARRVAAADPEAKIRFVWVGGEMAPGGLDDHRRSAEAAGVGDRVTFTGPTADVTSYFGASDLFALTSREDPFPLVNMEAMSSGLPVVAFADAGGAPELIGEDAGWVVPHLDVDAMAQAVLALAADRDRRRALGVTARKKVEARFDVDRYARDLLALAFEPSADPDPAR